MLGLQKDQRWYTAFESLKKSFSFHLNMRALCAFLPVGNFGPITWICAEPNKFSYTRGQLVDGFLWWMLLRGSVGNYMLGWAHIYPNVHGTPPWACFARTMDKHSDAETLV